VTDPHTTTAATTPRLGLLTVVRLVMNGAFRFLYPFLPVVARDLGVSPARAGLLVAAVAAGGVAAPLTRRAITGGHERVRRLAVGAAVVMATGTIVAAAATGLPVALLGLLALGAGKPLVDVATIAYVSERTSFDRRARATSIMELTWAGALVVIAPLAGVLAARTSWRVPLLLLGIASAAGALAMQRWLDADGSTRQRRAPRPPRWTPVERWLVVTAALVFAVLEATFSVFGLWLEADFGVGIEGLGAFAAITATGELVGSTTVLLAGDRWGAHRTAWAGLALASLGLTLMLGAPSLFLAVGAMAVGLCGSEMAIVSVLPLGSEVQPDSRSRFLAAMMSGASLTRALVAAGGAAVFAAAGIGANVAISVTAAAIAAGMLWHVLRVEPRLRG
jgi:DHA1 family inner membrane transport protein